MNQGGKHAESGRLENKRERRRGAAGRAAALRRAPSDSDCSGETASLSADSGDRAPRPAPLAPPRSGKTRSRRRGSEWEVLEGLKDGQRFEKRPDVFNGYLHKKRKWPLKGWHKRFFVVDGGILVYARSPTDVARGRLHGSVDVGLSVISAKARRRRIDIDADEFIYHLRAKTPEVFRTWLNVLKAHRLYRQHLLTFGARESVPKIHAPLDDLPATDTSSHTSFSTDTSDISYSESATVIKQTHNIDSSVYSPRDENSILGWQRDTLSKGSLIPLSFDDLDEKFQLKLDDTVCHTHRSLCSMQCVSRRYENELKRQKSPNISLNTTDAEKQITTTDLEVSLNGTKVQLDMAVIDKLNINRSSNDRAPNSENVCINGISTRYKEAPERKRSPFVNSTTRPPTTACFFFTKNKNQVVLKHSNEPLMKRSRKCTNLVKYKNLSQEPPLKNQPSKCMLLGKYKLIPSKTTFAVKNRYKAVACDAVHKENNEVQVKMEIKENKASQNSTSKSDYDKITEKLMLSIFRQNYGDGEKDVRSHIEQVVKDLYDIKVDKEIHPVKALFRNLLEYWLKNTSVAEFNEAMTSEKSVDRQSNKLFCKDEKLSSFYIRMNSKETQIHGFSDYTQNKVNKTVNTVRVKEKDANKERVIPIKCHSPRRDATDSFEKEKRIQQLERLLKNTVYVCETTRNNIKEKDIKITKTLIDNLGKSRINDKTSNEKRILDKSSSSAEIPEIQDTINHLISDTAIPPDVAKEFLGAYLDVLLQGSSKSTTPSQLSDWEKSSQEMPVCEVVAEAIVKKVSKSITASQKFENLPTGNTMGELQPQMDSGQVYLKDILNRVTTIFSKVNKAQEVKDRNAQKEGPQPIENTTKNECVKPVFKFSKKDLVYENCNENSLIIDLSKYDLDYISMFNDPATKGVMSITITLREKLDLRKDSKENNFKLKFSEDGKPIVSYEDDSDNWLPFINPEDSASNDIFGKVPVDTKNITYLEFETNRNNDLKPYSSNGSSRAHRPKDDSFNTIKNPTSHIYNEIKATVAQNGHEEVQSECYVMSIKKTGTIGSKFQLNKKKLKDSESKNEKITERSQSKASGPSKSEELSVFEKPTPKTIDEKFVLLLLENLAYLSKNVPTLHKDINSLYVKLRKKYDKLVKACNNAQGLSLLGKIYSEDPCVNGNDRATQCDQNIHVDSQTCGRDTKTIFTNTYFKLNEEKCTSTSTPTELLNSKCIQTIGDTNDCDLDAFKRNVMTQKIDHVKIASENAGTSHYDRITVTETETVAIDSIEQSTSTPNWNKVSCKDCTINTIARNVQDKASSNTPKTTIRPVKIDRRGMKKKRHPSKIRTDLLKEISRLSPVFKTSKQSQTAKQPLHASKKKDKDFNIYQLFKSKKCKLKVSSSMIHDNIKAQISDDMKTLYRCTSDPSNCSGLLSPTTPTLRGPQAGFVSGTPGGRLAGWIIESGGPLENASRELGQAQLSVQQLQRLLDALELQQQVHHDTDVSLEGASPNVKKDRRKFGLRKKKSNSKCASVELAPPHIDPSSSHTALSSLSALTAPPSPGGGASSMPNSAASLPIACAAARPQSLPGAESLNTAPGPASLTSLTPDHQLREDFTVLAKDLVASLKGIVSNLVCERGRLRAALEAGEPAAGGGVVSALRTNLTSALQQNSELRSRLSRIHDASDIAEIVSVANSDAVTRQFQQSLSYSSSCVSASEFFDAEEHDDDDLKHDDDIVADEAGVIELDGDSSSEAGSLSSEEGSASSDNSDGAMLSAEQVTLRHDPAPCWTRRTRLPAPRPSPGGPSLWNLLYKNIGKDLSQISMPVTINEPLNMLQRLCEELEYSELLDSAAECKSGVERMALIAAFAVSAYAASAHRAASKPFNPLLAETYECVRDDRGFRFLAEQVSHHPPISACHAESPRWCFWQEARIKTKFWGKSMEFQPTGRVHVRLNTTGDHYTWNKVTTCVHNLFGGQRWVDQYGDMHIACLGTDISCKLNFIKASSWSQTRHEVRGAITQAGSGLRLRLAGRWSEALYVGEPPAARCLWRPGAMPPEHELYYGFTRFAMELNEMEPGMRQLLPHTDTRLRPDQRALEEGDVEAAEAFKLDLEQSQRERRRESPSHAPAWFRKTVEDGEETWVFSGEYWKAREAGFSDDAAPRIW